MIRLLKMMVGITFLGGVSLLALYVSAVWEIMDEYSYEKEMDEEYADYHKRRVNLAGLMEIFIDNPEDIILRAVGIGCSILAFLAVASIIGNSIVS